MFTINENLLHNFIKDDLPYYDLTTMLQDANGKEGTLEIFTRDNVVVSCISEACKIAQILGLEVRDFIPEKELAKNGDVLLRLSGSYEKLHHAWRSCQNLLEYSCAIATYTHEFVRKIKTINPKCQLLATRKSFPFAKEFCIKSVLNGAGMIHRLNLSETVLFFANHKTLYSCTSEFISAVEKIKEKVPEKKIVVETKKLSEAVKLIDAKIDVIQTDKLCTKELNEVITYKNQSSPHTKIIAAGGINQQNCEDYVKTGIDAIITSSVYNAKLADFGCKIKVKGKN